MLPRAKWRRVWRWSVAATTTALVEHLTVSVEGVESWRRFLGCIALGSDAPLTDFLFAGVLAPAARIVLFVR